ncbi:MAG: competence/damage-inducible protein A [Bacteroidetes bacterium]|nr:competence/damage-inducible protein A [Bacteroidota bacterium]
MKATVITIGDEILIGQIVDTNSAWIGQRFNELGVKIHEIISCGDNKEQIIDALNRARRSSQLVLMTGGLGPTRDDITKDTLVEYFDTELVLDNDLWEQIKEIFAKRGKQVLELNRSQAMIPKNCTMLPNQKGTAPGMWFEQDGVIFLSVPGVPHEMKHVMENQVFPRLKERFSFPSIAHASIMTAGAGESILADMLTEFEDQLPTHIKLAYLPNLGVVRLRLSAFGGTIDLKQEVQEQKEKMKAALGSLVYCDGEESLEVTMGKMLLNEKATVSCAESCTGGYVSHLFTSVPGSSKYFEGGVVSYSYEVKEKLLGVKNATLNSVGAVSEECVREMLTGILKATGTTYGISISGIAGPDGGTADKPVGTVWIAVGNKDRMVAKMFHYFPARAENIRMFSYAALNMLRLFMMEKLK